MLTQSIIVKCARIGLAGVLGIAAAGVTVIPSASAYQSRSTNGCYVQYWKTAWEAKCAGATQSGNYQAHVARSYQSDYVGQWYWQGKDSYGTWDKGEARHKVQASGTYVSYSE